MALCKPILSILLIIFSIASFSQEHRKHQFRPGKEYVLKTNFDNKLFRGKLIKVDSLGIIIETPTNPSLGVPFDMIESISTQMAYLNVKTNKKIELGYLVDIDDKQIILENKKSGIFTIKLSEIDRIIVKKGSLGWFIFGGAVVGASFVIPDREILSPEERRGFGALGAVVGSVAGLFVGLISIGTPKTYSDVQSFLNDFEPWLEGTSVLPKSLTKTVSISY